MELIFNEMMQYNMNIQRANMGSIWAGVILCYVVFTHEATLRAKGVRGGLPHGIITASSRLPHGFRTASSRLPHGSLTASSRLPHGFLTALSRLPHGFLTALDLL